MGGISEGPQGSVESWLAAVGDGNWLGILVLAAAPLFPLLVPVLVKLLVGRLSGEPAGLGIGRRYLRFRAVLQPSRYVSAEYVYEAGRMPLDPRLKATGRLGALRRLLFLAIRPSSPKPAFLVSSLLMVGSVHVQGTAHTDRAKDGRLFIGLHPNESPQHLVSSLAAGRLRPTRALLVCPLEAFLESGGPFEVYFVDRRFTKAADDDPGAVVAFGSDPLYAQRQRNEILKSGEPPEDAIWLLLMDQRPTADGRSPRLGEEAANATPDNPDSKMQAKAHCENDAVDRAARGPERDRAVDGANREAWSVARLGRYLAVILTTAPGALLLSSMVLQGWAGGLPEAALVCLLVVGELLVWAGLSVMVDSCRRYWRYERRLGRRWTATTTNCLSDGKRIRRGNREAIKRDDRFRTRIRPKQPHRRPAE